MAKNDLLLRQRQREDAIMKAAERLMEQFMEDTLECAAHRCGVGYADLCRILDVWDAVKKEYASAMMPNSDPEADVAQEHMDREIQSICGKRRTIDPFRVRYPELKTITYEGRRR